MNCFVGNNSLSINTEGSKKTWIPAGHVAAAWKGSHHGVFPWPQTILKQLEEWHVIVSCDQLGETFQATPTLLIPVCPLGKQLLHFARPGQLLACPS